MGFLKELFGSSKEVWQQFANEIGGEYVDRGFWKSKKVIGKFESWTVVLDTFTRSSGKHSTTYTRIRAPFKTVDELQFKIHRRTIFSNIDFGMQIIKTGYDEFDEQFIIKGNYESKIKDIFSVDKLRHLISNQDKVLMKIKDDTGLFNRNLSEGNYELYFESIGVIKDVDRLKELFNIFVLLLNTLSFIESASRENIYIDLN
ncbi:MAG: DUF3137 domain-containing protein [Tissierella sp.]|nr:DUF3137 domain-containing protein [Tissierella sp.]